MKTNNALRYAEFRVVFNLVRRAVAEGGVAAAQGGVSAEGAGHFQALGGVF